MHIWKPRSSCGVQVWRYFKSSEVHGWMWALCWNHQYNVKISKQIFDLLHVNRIYEIFTFYHWCTSIFLSENPFEIKIWIDPFVFRVVNMKEDPYYWYLALTVLCLAFEGIFTLAIKETQEWKFFSPTVFLYLARSDLLMYFSIILNQIFYF